MVPYERIDWMAYWLIIYIYIYIYIYIIIIIIITNNGPQTYIRGVGIAGCCSDRRRSSMSCDRRNIRPTDCSTDCEKNDKRQQWIQYNEMNEIQWKIQRMASSLFVILGICTHAALYSRSRCMFRTPDTCRPIRHMFWENMGSFVVSVLSLSCTSTSRLYPYMRSVGYLHWRVSTSLVFYPNLNLL